MIKLCPLCTETTLPLSWESHGQLFHGQEELFNSIKEKLHYFFSLTFVGKKEDANALLLKYDVYDLQEHFFSLFFSF